MERSRFFPKNVRGIGISGVLGDEFRWESPSQMFAAKGDQVKMKDDTAVLLKDLIKTRRLKIEGDEVFCTSSAS
jgi:hypothetical protein